MLLLDVLQLAEEPPPQAGRELRVWPRGARAPCTVRPAQVEPLLQLWVRQGQVTALATPRPSPPPAPSPTPGPEPALPFPLAQLCQPLPSLAESRAFAQLCLSRLSPDHRRLEQPAPYQVGGEPTSATICMPSAPAATQCALLSSLQVALSEKLQALLHRLSAGAPL